MRNAAYLSAGVFLWLIPGLADSDGQFPISIRWESNILTVSGAKLGGREIEVLYLEAYCRAGAHEVKWDKTVIEHTTEMVSAKPTQIKLRCTLKDGVVVDHIITAGKDEVDFRLTARNPTDKTSEAQWAQPCIRVGAFTGLGNPQNPATYEYLRKSFVFLDGKLERMPTRDWATDALYTPGQVWAAPGVNPKDVNPRPLNRNVPSNGLIGCFSEDEQMIFATAWEPYHELFQGVYTCLHSDFRIGGLRPGGKKQVRGKMYFLKNDIPALLRRYRKDVGKSDRFERLD